MPSIAKSMRPVCKDGKNCTKGISCHSTGRPNSFPIASARSTSKPSRRLVAGSRKVSGG